MYGMCLCVLGLLGYIILNLAQKVSELTGFFLMQDTQQYFAKPTPARKGDYLEFIAEMDLLCALSACPQGDVSTAVGQVVPDSKCFPLRVEVFRSDI